jgi:tetratricopeptide (TPR) repeat protein
MSEGRYQYDRIEAYIKGELSSADKYQFEVDLKTDTLLAEHFQLQLMEHEAMEFMISEGLRNKFSEWERNPSENPYPDKVETGILSRVGYGRLKWIIAAFVLILTIIIIILMLNRFKSVQIESKEPNLPSIKESTIQSADDMPSQEDLMLPGLEEKVIPDSSSRDESEERSYKRKEKGINKVNGPRVEIAYIEIAQEFYEQPEEFFIVLRSDSKEQDDKYSQALEKYEKSQYNEALAMLVGIDFQSQSQAQYLLGHIYFQLQRYNEAAITFEKIVTDPLLPVFEEARWYLFLTYTAALPKSQKKWDALRRELESDKGFSYKNDLQRLVFKMDRLK